MSHKIVITNTRKQNQIVKASAAAEHRRYHLSVANDMRNHADKIEANIELYKSEMGSEVDPTAIEYMEKEAFNMRARAIAEENVKCMEKRH